MWPQICLVYFILKTIQCVSHPLLLTPLIEAGNVTEAKELSSVNPCNFLGFESYTGFITVNKEFNSNLFFWFVPSQGGNLEETPWIIWLQGGPGWSSLVGLFDLIGPFQIKNGQVAPRNVTWASNYSLLFIDNPVGTGFSFTDDDQGVPDNEDDVGEQLYDFLRQFLQVFPALKESPLFLAGQSYAGKYVPALGIQIHRRKGLEPKINLKGLAIGNGLIDPKSMMHYSQLCDILGILDGQEIERVKHLEQRVVRLIDAGHLLDASNAFNETIEYIKKHSGVSVYNFHDDPSLSPNAMEAFVNRKEVRDRIHVGDLPFYLNNQAVYNKMLPDVMNSSKPWVEELLESYPVMGYSGQYDVLVPYWLSKFTYNALKWSKSEDYHNAERKLLYDPSNTFVVGYVKSGGNFVEAMIRRAGHGAYEQPDVVKRLIDEFIKRATAGEKEEERGGKKDPTKNIFSCQNVANNEALNVKKLSDLM